MEQVPQYVSRSVPVSLSNRVPWYKSTFPTYAGIFLWVGFYLKLAEPTIEYASISVCLLGLLVAGLLCFGLYYFVPAMLGMQTGHPLEFSEEGDFEPAQIVLAFEAKHLSARADDADHEIAAVAEPRSFGAAAGR